MYSCCEEKRCWLFARPMSEKQIRQDITKKLQSNIQPASSASSVLPLADVPPEVCSLCAPCFSLGKNNIRSGYCGTLPKQVGKIRSTVIIIFWQAKCHFVKKGMPPAIIYQSDKHIWETEQAQRLPTGCRYSEQFTQLCVFAWDNNIYFFQGISPEWWHNSWCTHGIWNPFASIKTKHGNTLVHKCLSYPQQEHLSCHIYHQ